MRTRWIAAAVIVCLVGVGLWLGQWRYLGKNEFIRVNRFSGSAYRLTPEGWQKMQATLVVKPGRSALAIDSITAVERAGNDTGPLYREYLREQLKKPDQKSTPAR
jgi:hypothetical protein